MESGVEKMVFGLTIDAITSDSAKNQAKKISQGCKPIGVFQVPTELEKKCIDIELEAIQKGLMAYHNTKSDTGLSTMAEDEAEKAINKHLELNLEYFIEYEKNSFLK